MFSYAYISSSVVTFTATHAACEASTNFSTPSSLACSHCTNSLSNTSDKNDTVALLLFLSPFVPTWWYFRTHTHDPACTPVTPLVSITNPTLSGVTPLAAMTRSLPSALLTRSFRRSAPSTAVGAHPDVSNRSHPTLRRLQHA